MLDDPIIKAKRLNGEKWYEIDDIQDLDIAESIFAENEEKADKLTGGRGTAKGRKLKGDHARKSKQRPHGKVDAPRADDKGHADGNDPGVARLPEHNAVVGRDPE